MGGAGGGGMHLGVASALNRKPSGSFNAGAGHLHGVLKQKTFTPPASGRVRFISMAKQGSMKG
jgi:hypothetical protein